MTEKIETPSEPAKAETKTTRAKAKVKKGALGEVGKQADLTALNKIKYPKPENRLGIKAGPNRK